MQTQTLPPLHCERTTGFLEDFIRKQLADAGYTRLVIGLSGGIDSALVAHLAVRSIGAEQVFGFFMPYHDLHDEHAADVQELAGNLQISVESIPIAPHVDPYFSAQHVVDQTRRGNKMARERMSILFDQAAAHQALVIGTSNKTEALLGYGTLFGDTAWSFCPITNLYKTHVRELARHLNVPEKFLTKAPTAGLWKGQTDEGELGYSYELLDQFLYQYEDLQKSKVELLAAGFADELIDTISERVEKNRFKGILPASAVIGERFFHDV